MRRLIIFLATVALAGALYGANIGTWAGDVGIEDVFVAATMESFELEGSYEAIADILTEEIIERFPSAESAELQLNTLLVPLVASPAFEPALEDLSRQVYASAVLGTGTAVLIDLSEYEEVILSAVAVFSPTLADQLPSELFTTYTVIDAEDVRDISDDLSSARTLGLVAFAAIVVLVGIIMVFGDTWSMRLAAIGFALLLTTGLIFVLSPSIEARFTVDVADHRFAVLTENLGEVLVDLLTSQAVLVAIASAVVLVVALVAARLAASRQA